MGLMELLAVAVGLSMDAFAVAVCKGLAAPRLRLGHMALAGVYFGAFQALMPLLGFWLSRGLAGRIEAFDHWAVFFLLALLGGMMIREGLDRDGSTERTADFGLRAMLPLALATSIDALAVGVSFAFLHVSILPAAALIGATTFVLSALGVGVGFLSGARSRAGAEIAGGVILITLGIKILLEHLGAF